MAEYEEKKKKKNKLIAFSDTLTNPIQEAFYAEKDAIKRAEDAEEKLQNLMEQVSENHWLLSGRVMCAAPSPRS